MSVHQVEPGEVIAYGDGELVHEEVCRGAAMECQLGEALGVVDIVRDTELLDAIQVGVDKAEGGRREDVEALGDGVGRTVGRKCRGARGGMRKHVRAGSRRAGSRGSIREDEVEAGAVGQVGRYRREAPGGGGVVGEDEVDKAGADGRLGDAAGATDGGAGDRVAAEEDAHGGGAEDGARGAGVDDKGGAGEVGVRGVGVVEDGEGAGGAGRDEVKDGAGALVTERDEADAWEQQGGGDHAGGGESEDATKVGKVADAEDVRGGFGDDGEEEGDPHAGRRQVRGGDG